MNKQQVKQLARVMREWYSRDRRMCMPTSERSRFLIERVKPVLRRIERLAAK